MYFVVGKFNSNSNHHYAKRKKLLRKLLATLQLLKKLKVLSVQLRVRRDHPRLCSVEEVQAWRAKLAQWVGPGQARVAHRVLGDGQRRAGTLHGHTQQGTLTWGTGACLLYGNDLILKILQINWHFSFSYIYNDKLYRMLIYT